jgi:trehalose 6-phosphate phosphatase
MKHAIKQWTSINKRIKGKTILLFLDFDGTLAPIASTPARARLPSRTKKLLRQLHSIPNIKVAIISGRDLDDIKKMVGIPGIICAGNHGCQISGSGIDWQHDFPTARQRKLQKLYKELSIAMKEICGVLIENKNMSIAVHYRNVKNADMARFRKALTEISSPYISSLFIKASFGKKVLELGLATTWNKGKAVNWLIRSLKLLGSNNSCVPICIGDDVTDETGFKTLKHKGITIHVGAGKQSTASYYLRNPSDVATFLRKLSVIR